MGGFRSGRKSDNAVSDPSASLSFYLDSHVSAKIIRESDSLGISRSKYLSQLVKRADNYSLSSFSLELTQLLTHLESDYTVIQTRMNFLYQHIQDLKLILNRLGVDHE